jgi:hypothetical protein
MESVVKEEEFLTKGEIKSVIKKIIEGHYRYISSSGTTFQEIKTDFLYWLEKHHRKCNWSLEPILNELIKKGEVVIQGTTLDDRLTFRLFHRPIK